MTILFGNTVNGLSALNLTTQTSARSSLDTVRTQRESVTSSLATIGAAQSRLETAARNLNTARANFTSASSRITDADIASESASLVRQQILQQAWAAVLAQANQAPALALTLLT